MAPLSLRARVVVLKDGEVMLHSCRAHPDFPTLAKNVAVLYEQRKSQGSESLQVNLKTFSTQKSPSRIREEIVLEIPCSRLLTNSTY